MGLAGIHGYDIVQLSLLFIRTYARGRLTTALANSPTPHFNKSEQYMYSSASGGRYDRIYSNKYVPHDVQHVLRALPLRLAVADPHPFSLHSPPIPRRMYSGPSASPPRNSPHRSSNSDVSHLPSVIVIATALHAIPECQCGTDTRALLPRAYFPPARGTRRTVSHT